MINFEMIWKLVGVQVFEDEGSEFYKMVKECVEKNGKGMYRVIATRGENSIEFIGADVTMEKIKEEIREDMDSDEEFEEYMNEMWCEVNDVDDDIDMENESGKIAVESEESLVLLVK